MKKILTITLFLLSLTTLAQIETHIFNTAMKIEEGLPEEVVEVATIIDINYYKETATFTSPGIKMDLEIKGAGREYIEGYRYRTLRLYSYKFEENLAIFIGDGEIFLVDKTKVIIFYNE